MASASLSSPTPNDAADPCRWTVLIDADGAIQTSDGQWPMVSPAFCIGSSYYRFLARICGDNHARQAAITAGIQAIAEGQSEAFHIDFPYRLPDRITEVRLAATSHREGILLQHTETAAESDPQSLKMEVLGRLTSGVVHDFANLLTLISGYTEIVLNRLGVEDPTRRELEEIRKATAHGFGMTGQILDFIRKPATLPSIVDLNALVAETGNLLQPIIGEHISLVTALDPGAGMVSGDPVQISRVMMNLILNARDAMPHGGSITISTAGQPLPSRLVTLEITDTGCGMDAQTLRQIFKPFFTKGKSGGTGLGLSNVRRIIQQMGGDVQVHSESGQGTRFTICLQRAAEAGDTLLGDARRDAFTPGSETILLVEDEESVRKLLKHLLAATGYRVLDAKDGREALGIFHQHAESIDLLLTDVMMPGMNGRELAREASAAKSGLKVIYMSGYTDDVLLTVGPSTPGISFLRKPLKLDVLSAVVREVLDTPVPR